MSYDLLIWYSSRAPSEDDALEVLDRVVELDYNSLEPSAGIQSFLDDVFSRYPSLGDDDDNTPWSFTDDVSEKHALLSMQRTGRVYRFILRLCRKYGLRCFDPQTDAVYGPKFPWWSLIP